MNTFSKFLATSVAALSLGLVAAPAQSAIYISFDGSTDAHVDLDDSDGFAYVANCGVDNCGGFSAVDVDGQTNALPELLHSDSVSATNALGDVDLTIWVTRTGLTQSSFVGFIDDFNTSTGRAGNGFTFTLETFIDDGDGTYGGSPLSFYQTSELGSTSGSEFNYFSPTGTFSITQKYTIVGTGIEAGKSAQASIVTTGVVPEPGTWALMIMGFGGAGAMLRRRRSALAAA